MRNLAHELGVEAMSLYYHVANKDAVLDGVVEVIMDEINQAVSVSRWPSGDRGLEGGDAHEDPRRPGSLAPPPLGARG